MNRLVTLLALAIALGGPASAQTSYAIAPDFRIPRVVGGEVYVSGGRVLGKGFSSRIVTAGEYEIVFQPRLFSGCPVMTVTPMGAGDNPPTGEVYQPSVCSATFYVFWHSENIVENTVFQFVAVGTSGQ
ncbi:MAG: hypothetical protein WCE97_10915 [Candidatus Cybelea sp.]